MQPDGTLTHPSLSIITLAGSLDSLQCLHWTDECKSLLFGQHWCVHELESKGEHCLWVRLYFLGSGLHILLILLAYFARWEVSSHTTTVSRICSKQYVIFLCSFHLAFSPGISLKLNSCGYTVVLTQLELGRISVTMVLMYRLIPSIIIQMLTIINW